jgi:hypothetical protein
VKRPGNDESDDDEERSRYAPQRGTGLPAYHEADERWTDRHATLRYGREMVALNPCRLRVLRPFWSSSEEEAAYTRAVRLCPVGEYGHLEFFDYLAEVGKVARHLLTGQEGPSLPRPAPLRAQEYPRAIPGPVVGPTGAVAPQVPE